MMLEAQSATDSTTRQDTCLLVCIYVSAGSCMQAVSGLGRWAASTGWGFIATRYELRSTNITASIRPR